MKTQSYLNIYEVNGSETEINRPQLIVESHRIRKRHFVVLELDGYNITVSAKELMQAIDSATNTI